MGRNKALLELDGVSLLKHQINRAAPFFDEVILLSGQNNYKADNRQLNDRFENAGPLAGLLEALKDKSGPSAKQIVMIPVDLPRLSAETFHTLSLLSISKSDEAAILRSGEDLQPLAGVYSTDLADSLESYLKKGNRMVFGFLKKLNYSTIEVKREELKNFNTPEDFLSED